MRRSAMVIAATLGLVQAAAAQPIDIESLRKQVCDLDVRDVIVAAIQHGEGETDALIVENTADWVPKFNAFTVSNDAALLRAYAEGAAATGDGSYGAAACHLLVPLANMSLAGPIVSGAGAAITAGHLLEQCEGGVCTPSAIAAIPERCGTTTLEVPLSYPCAAQTP